MQKCLLSYPKLSVPVLWIMLTDVQKADSVLFRLRHIEVSLFALMPMRIRMNGKLRISESAHRNNGYNIRFAVRRKYGNWMVTYDTYWKY